MNKVALVAIALVAIAATAGAAPWYAGMRAEQAMRADAEALGAGKQSPFAISYTRFDRGWRTSQAVSRVALKADPGVYFEVRHEISHMPDRDSWVRVHSVPQLSGPVKASLDYYFSGQPPLTVDTVIDYRGNRVMQLSSPAFSKPMHQRPEATLSWGGLRARLSVDANDHWVATAAMPSLMLEGGDTRISLNMLKVDGVWDLRGAAIDWQNETKIGISEFRVVTPLQQFAIQDLSGAAYQRSNDHTVTLGYALRIGSGSATQAAANSQTISNAVLEIELDKLDKKALAKYLGDLSSAETLGVAPELRTRLATQLIANLGAELLRGSPELRVKQLGVETPSGGVLAHATISFDGTNLPNATLSAELLARLKGKADLRMSGSLLRMQMQQQLRPQVEVALRQQGGLSTEENIRALAEKATEEQLKGFTDAGLLRSNGADFVIEAEFTHGQMLVNGLPANQLFGGMLSAPVTPAIPEEKARKSEAAAPASVRHSRSSA